MRRQVLHLVLQFKILLLVTAGTSVFLSGCSEGPMWRASRFAPWVQQKWRAEEEIAQTVYSKRRKLNEIADNASRYSAEESDQIAEELSKILRNERTLIVRLESVRTLGKLSGPVADAALSEAVKDPELDIRVAAVQAWKHREQPTAIPILQEVINSDTDSDVRREAIRSMASFRGVEVLSSLNSALTDKDPATQFRAIESLRQVTGENFGPNVASWQNYLQTQLPQPAAAIANRPVENLKK